MSLKPAKGCTGIVGKPMDTIPTWAGILQRKIGVVVLANAAINIDDIGFLLMSESAKLVDTYSRSIRRCWLSMPADISFPMMSS